MKLKTLGQFLALSLLSIVMLPLAGCDSDGGGGATITNVAFDCTVGGALFDQLRCFSTGVIEGDPNDLIFEWRASDQDVRRGRNITSITFNYSTECSQADASAIETVTVQFILFDSDLRSLGESAKDFDICAAVVQ